MAFREVRGMLTRIHFNIWNPQIAGNPMKLLTLPSPRNFVSFYTFMIPSGRSFWLLGGLLGGGWVGTLCSGAYRLN